MGNRAIIVDCQNDQLFIALLRQVYDLELYRKSTFRSLIRNNNPLCQKLINYPLIVKIEGAAAPHNFILEDLRDSPVLRRS